MKKRILVIGDNQSVCRSIQENMQNSLTEVYYTMSGSEALDILTKNNCCLVIMDFDLFRKNDFGNLRTFREAKPVPIIALITKLTSADRIALFQAGANAYWEKPLNLEVCIAQANSLIQLYMEAQIENRTQRPLIFGTELIIDPIYRQVIADGEQVILTRTEFDLLFCLAQHPERIWSRKQLYCHIWGDDLGISGDNTVRAHIGNLRKKLTDAGRNYIHNSRGIGYKFVPPVSCSKIK